jgi:hypothetical protein
MPKLITKARNLDIAVSARVTQKERRLLEKRAQGEGLTLSQWARRELLASVSVSHDTRLILSELDSIWRLLTGKRTRASS